MRARSKVALAARPLDDGISSAPSRDVPTGTTAEPLPDQVDRRRAAAPLRPTDGEEAR